MSKTIFGSFELRRAIIPQPLPVKKQQKKPQQLLFLFPLTNLSAEFGTKGGGTRVFLGGAELFFCRMTRETSPEECSEGLL